MSHALVIPIVIRSLAGRYLFDGSEGNLIPFDSSILSCLDAGENHQINSFALPWWTGRKPRDVTSVEALGPATLKKCLDHYRDQKSLSKNLPAGAGAGAGQFLNAETSGADTPRSPRNPGTLGKFLAPEAVSSRTPPTSSAPNPTNTFPTKKKGTGCKSCRKYRQLLSDLLQDVLKFRNFVSTMSTSSENLLNIGIRKASSFNLLHQAAILKETAGMQPPATTNTGDLISSVFNKASSELNRLQQLPPSSYKWTWGETLTIDEVIMLRRTGTRPGRAAHSGYDLSLPEGKLAGDYSEYSEGPVPGSTSYDDLPVEATLFIPPTDLHFPKHFEKRDFLSYNPFPISASICGPNLTLARAQVDSPSPSNIAEVWSDGSGASAGRAVTASDNQFWGSVPEPALSMGASDRPVPVTDSNAGDTIIEEVAEDVFQLAEDWNDEHDVPDQLDDQDPLDIWDAEEEVEVEKVDEDNGEHPAQLALADVWISGEEEVDEDNSEDPDPLALADLWNAEEEEDKVDDNGEELTRRSFVDSDPLALADLWIGEEEEDEVDDNGEELTSPSYVHQIPGNDGPAGDMESDWSYGPQHFQFLKEEMFASDDEESF
jgi:hypothetical protein